MSDMGSYESDMVWLSRISEAEVERVLEGEYAGEDPSLHALATYARGAKATFAAAPDEATRATHLMAIAEAAVDVDATPAPVLTPAPSSPFRRMKIVLTSLFASLIGKIALASVALAATTGGLAATGSLPDPAQEALARAGEKVGFDLPVGGDRATDGDDAGVPDDLPEGAGDSSAPSVLDVIRSWDDEKGCEFGHAVATAAGGRPGPCADGQGGRDGGPRTMGSRTAPPKASLRARENPRAPLRASRQAPEKARGSRRGLRTANQRVRGSRRQLLEGAATGLGRQAPVTPTTEMAPTPEEVSVRRATCPPAGAGTACPTPFREPSRNCGPDPFQTSPGAPGDVCVRGRIDA